MSVVFIPSTQFIAIVTKSMYLFDFIIDFYFTINFFDLSIYAFTIISVDGVGSSDYLSLVI